MSEQISVGNWVVAGGRDDLDMGKILELTSDDEMQVGWVTGVTTSCPISPDDVEIFDTRAQAEERFIARRKANPPPMSIPSERA